MPTPAASPAVSSTVGLKNMVIAPLTVDTEETLTYGALQLIAGAIEASITPQNADPDVQYADDAEFDVLYPDPELTFTTKMADIPLTVQEMIFGTTSWDYSNLPFNLNGRICLLYSVFWGILGVMWIKDIYPRMSRWILKIPNKLGKGLTWALLAFMIFNTVMSGLTVLRWTNRREGVPAANGFERYLDRHYPDERMQKIYANMIFPDD